MSMTGRWIDRMREQADAGDAEMQESLGRIGLWQSEEEAAALAAAAAGAAAASADEEEYHAAELQREAALDLRHAEFQREIEANWFDQFADETGEEF